MLIVIPLLNEVKPVAVWEVEKMHPSIYKHMDNRSKAEKSSRLDLTDVWEGVSGFLQPALCCIDTSVRKWVKTPSQL